LGAVALEEGRKAEDGGSMLATVKKLKGARLRRPVALKVETKATGRGTTAPARRR